MAYKVEMLMERYHSLFVWFISVRYILIGIEYICLAPESRRFWAFGEIWPQVIGIWMLIVGLVGLLSRYACAQCWTRRARKLTTVFIIGVIGHSLFRLTLLVQQQSAMDPMVILFGCDLAAVVWLKFQLRKWVYCSK